MASGKSRSCERSEPVMCDMPDSTAPQAKMESG
jgi:hypothetical protein